jgi:hypothetical protein
MPKKFKAIKDLHLSAEDLNSRIDEMDESFLIELVQLGFVEAVENDDKPLKDRVAELEAEVSKLKKLNQTIAPQYGKVLYSDRPISN